MATVKQALTDEQIRDFLTDADFGHGDWFDYVTTPNNSQTVGEIAEIEEDGTVVETFHYTYADVRDSIDAYADELGVSVEDFMDSQYDAYDADAIMQMVTFGEIRYS